MRVIAAVPAAGFLAGCALGLAAPDRSLIPPLAVLALAAGVAFAASAAVRPHLLVFAVGIAFCAGGVVVSTLAWQRAWRSPLRVAFDRIEHWTGHGAQMSPTVERLVAQAKAAV